MRVTLALAMSLDGRITSGEPTDTGAWISAEDQAMFAHLKEEHETIIMGSKTYRANKARMKIDPLKPRVIMTRFPVRYASEAQRGLEFTDESPHEILDRLEAQGYNDTLLLGGAATNACFFKEGLVDELAITVEPKIFGAGLPLTDAFEGSIDLRHISSQTLNEEGTMFIRYQVVSPTE